MEFDFELNPDSIGRFFRRIKAEGVTQDFLDSLADLDDRTAVRLINEEIVKIRDSDLV